MPSRTLYLKLFLLCIAWAILGSGEIATGAEMEEVANDQSATPTGLLPDWGGQRARLAERGVEHSVQYIGEVLGNVSGGIRRGAIYEGLLKAQFDFDLEKLGAWQNGAVHVSGLYPHGRSLSENYVGDLFTFSNIDAPDSPRLFELWYEHALLPGTLTLRLGQLAADEEFAFTDYGSLFINGTCGWPALIGANVPSPVYPVATPGARLEWKFAPAWTLRTAVFNGDPYPLDAGGQPRNEHGTWFGWQDTLALAELHWRWQRGENARGLPGAAKLGGWYHSGEFADYHLDENGRSLADPAGSGQPYIHRGNWGIYLTAEQQVWREGADKPEQGLGLFARAGGAPDYRNTLALYLEGGCNYTGLIPGRDADGFGVAVVYAQLSDAVRDLARDANFHTGSFETLPDYEMVVESTYRFALRPGLELQPVIGWVIHPGCQPGHEALVLGLRAVFDF